MKKEVEEINQQFPGKSFASFNDKKLNDFVKYVVKIGEETFPAVLDKGVSEQKFGEEEANEIRKELTAALESFNQGKDRLPGWRDANQKQVVDGQKALEQEITAAWEEVFKKLSEAPKQVSQLEVPEDQKAAHENFMKYREQAKELVLKEIEMVEELMDYFDSLKPPVNTELFNDIGSFGGIRVLRLLARCTHRLDLAFGMSSYYFDQDQTLEVRDAPNFTDPLNYGLISKQTYFRMKQTHLNMLKAAIEQITDKAQKKLVQEVETVTTNYVLADPTDDVKDLEERAEQSRIDWFTKSLIYGPDPKDKEFMDVLLHYGYRDLSSKSGNQELLAKIPETHRAKLKEVLETVTQRHAKIFWLLFEAVKNPNGLSEEKQKEIEEIVTQPFKTPNDKASIKLISGDSLSSNDLIKWVETALELPTSWSGGRVFKAFKAPISLFGNLVRGAKSKIVTTWANHLANDIKDKQLNNNVLALAWALDGITHLGYTLLQTLLYQLPASEQNTHFEYFSEMQRDTIAILMQRFCTRRLQETGQTLPDLLGPYTDKLAELQTELTVDNNIAKQYVAKVPLDRFLVNEQGTKKVIEIFSRLFRGVNWLLQQIIRTSKVEIKSEEHAKLVEEVRNLASQPMTAKYAVQTDEETLDQVNEQVLAKAKYSGEGANSRHVTFWAELFLGRLKQLDHVIDAHSSDDAKQPFADFKKQMEDKVMAFIQGVKVTEDQKDEILDLFQAKGFDRIKNTYLNFEKNHTSLAPPETAAAQGGKPTTATAAKGKGKGKGKGNKKEASAATTETVQSEGEESSSQPNPPAPIPQTGGEGEGEGEEGGAAEVEEPAPEAEPEVTPTEKEEEGGVPKAALIFGLLGVGLVAIGGICLIVLKKSA